jgi:hypothetical protein
MAEALAHVDRKIDVKVDALEARMDGRFSDLEGVIRFSHAHLIHRIERIETRPGS